MKALCILIFILGFGLATVCKDASTQVVFDDTTIALVPEPAQAAMLIPGIVMLGAMARRRSRS